MLKIEEYKDNYVWKGIGNNICNEIQNGQTKSARTVTSYIGQRVMFRNDYKNGASIKWTGSKSELVFAFF